MFLSTLIQHLDATFHPEYQENYDNSGFLLGDPRREVTGVLVAVDLTEAVAAEAIERGFNLIVTHHPFIFNGLKRITPDSTAGRIVMKLVENKVAVYAAHTNLDNLKNGVNGILAAHLGLEHCSILRPQHADAEVGAGMVGTLPYPVPTVQFLAQLKESLHLPAMRVVNGALEIRSAVQRVAVCGGAGKFLIGDAIAAGADVYITGDLKYHDFQEAEGKILLVDVGHYESEQLSRGLLAGTVDSMSDSSFKTRITTASDRWEEWL